MNDIDLALPVFDKMHEIEKELEQAKRGSELRARLLRKHSLIFDALYNTGRLYDYWGYAINRQESEKG